MYKFKLQNSVGLGFFGVGGGVRLFFKDYMILYQYSLHVFNTGILTVIQILACLQIFPQCQIKASKISTLMCDISIACIEDY